MPEPRPPSVRVRQLARELRRLRIAAGFTGEDVAQEFHWSAAKVSRLETARTSVTIADLRRLLDFYSVSDDLGDRLIDLAATAHERGWWEAYAGSIPQPLLTFIGLEADASVMRSHRIGVVGGLLQTEQYAFATIDSYVPARPPGEIDRLVQVRMKRQERLREGEPLELWTILEEGALRRRVGGAAVMRDQLNHLLDLSSLSNVTIQVLPFEVGAYPGPGMHFNILSFPGSVYPDIVHVEELTGDLFVEDEKRIFSYVLAFEEIRRMALTPEDSLALISQIAEEMS
jgi:transcriptional regulator with XRE-family HTH domain